MRGFSGTPATRRRGGVLANDFELQFAWDEARGARAS